jgi:hypothetical protein
MLRPGAHEYDRKKDAFYCKFHYTSMKRTQMIEQTAKERGISDEVLYGPLMNRKHPPAKKHSPSPPKRPAPQKEASPSVKTSTTPTTASSKDHSSSPQIGESEYLEPPPVYAAVNKVPKIPPKAPTKKGADETDKVNLANALEKAAAKKITEESHRPAQSPESPPPSVSEGLLTGHYEMSDDVEAIVATLSRPALGPSGAGNEGLKLEDLPYGHYEVDSEFMKKRNMKSPSDEYEYIDEETLDEIVSQDPSPVVAKSEVSTSKASQPAKPKSQGMSPTHKTAAEEGESRKKPPPVPPGALVKPVPRRPPPPPPGRRPTGQQQPTKRKPKRKKSKSLREIDQELKSISDQQQELENRGVALEMEIRNNVDTIDKDDNLMDEWFDLIHKRNNLNEREEELVYTRKDLELIMQYDSLDLDLRERLSKPEEEKSMLEKLEEEAMIKELVDLVERRNQLVVELEEERLK